MEKIIKILELISEDIRSRQNADFIRDRINNYDGIVELDFKGVRFISRSFADELYTIVNEEAKNVLLINMQGIVKSMMDVVSRSRSHKRVRNDNNSNMKEFSDIESLSAFLATM